MFIKSLLLLFIYGLLGLSALNSASGASLEPTRVITASKGSNFAKQFRNSSDKINYFHIVLDLDGTLVYTSLKQIKDNHAIKVHGISYGLAHGLIEFLEVLSQFNNILITFYSAGQQNRNIELLKQVSLRVQQTTKKKFKYDLLSSEAIGAHGEKDLYNVVSAKDLSRTILIDDHPTATPEQVKNLLLVPEQAAECSENQAHSCDPNYLIKILGHISFGINQGSFFLTPTLNAPTLLHNLNDATLHEGLKFIHHNHPDFDLIR